MIYSTF